MFTRISAIIVLLAIATNAGILDDVSGWTSDVGNFFNNQFKNVKDLFGADQSELEKNVERVKELLNGVKEKMKMIEPMANDAQKATLKKVDEFLGEVTEFQSEVKKEGSEKFEENKNKWQTMVTDMFEKNGLGDIVKLLGLQNSASTGATCAAIIAPIFYAIFVR